jgi:hypothetical protein
MTRPFVPLGSTPFNETPTAYSDSNYRVNAMRECDAYIQAIRNYLGHEPAGAQLDTKVFDGDRGAYYEVVCYFDEGNKAAERYAKRCEKDAPVTWNDGSVKAPPKVGSPSRTR